MQGADGEKSKNSKIIGDAKWKTMEELQEKKNAWFSS
jgi:hypothetical protein